MVNIGKLKHRITLQTMSSKVDAYGERVDEWVDVKTVWADISPISGKQFYTAKQINSEISHNIYIRYTDMVKPDMRITFKERVFEILYIMNINEDNRLLQIYCKEVDDG